VKKLDEKWIMAYRIHLNPNFPDVAYVYAIPKGGEGRHLLLKTDNVNEEDPESVIWRELPLPRDGWLNGLTIDPDDSNKFFIVFGCASVPYAWDDALSKDSHNLFLILGIIAFLNAAVGSWLYLRILSGIYFKPAMWPDAGKSSFQPSFIPIFGCVIVTVILGVKPNLVINLDLLKGLGNPVIKASKLKIEDSQPSDVLVWKK